MSVNRYPNPKHWVRQYGLPQHPTISRLREFLHYWNLRHFANSFFLSPLRLVIVFHKWSSVEKSLIANQYLVSFQLGCIWRHQRARRSGRHCNWWHNCQRPTLSTTWVMWLWEWLVRVSEWFDWWWFRLGEKYRPYFEHRHRPLGWPHNGKSSG